MGIMSERGSFSPFHFRSLRVWRVGLLLWGYPFAIFCVPETGLPLMGGAPLYCLPLEVHGGDLVRGKSLLLGDTELPGVINEELTDPPFLLS